MINDGGGLGVAAKQAQRPNGAYARPKAPGSGGSNKLGPYNAQPPAIVISETRAAVAQRSTPTPKKQAEHDVLRLFPKLPQELG